MPRTTAEPKRWTASIMYRVNGGKPELFTHSFRAKDAARAGVFAGVALGSKLKLPVDGVLTIQALTIEPDVEPVTTAE